MNAMIRADYEALAPRAIALKMEQVDQARQQSCTITDPVQQWQQYLNALALFGFEQWLNQRASDLLINPSNTIVPESMTLPVVCNVRVNDFRVCLIPVESQPDEVELPALAITDPELAANFYVAVAIYEEQAQIAVHSFLRYDQITTRIQALQPDADHLYTLAINDFEPDLDRLLLYLRCSDPAAIPLPTPVANNQLTTSYPLIANSQQPTATSINIRRWLQNELDDLARQWSWVLLPSLTLENAMRLTARVVDPPSPQEGFESVIKQLVRNGMTLPPDARVAYQDLEIGRVAARLYAIAGTLPVTESPPEWTLLLVLGPRSLDPLPQGTQLQLCEAGTVLAQQTLSQPDTYLYAKVIGTLDEQFSATIATPNSDPLTLPPFAFQADP
ncbi:MAG: DUF1822 family protein [Tildeniella nuda ZEHNDER 1965/U140]|jgi:hypothetical protein|nr:DUF1822 family protein [Tildeniella nuda ZEHNDER 1965/U140]